MNGFSTDAVSLKRKAGADTMKVHKAEFQSSTCSAPERSNPFLWFPVLVSSPHTQEGEPGGGTWAICWQVDLEFTPLL